MQAPFSSLLRPKTLEPFLVSPHFEPSAGSIGSPFKVDPEFDHILPLPLLTFWHDHFPGLMQ